MKKNAWYLVGGFVALAAITFVGRNQLKSVIINGADALQNRNVQAFLALIRKFESAGKYNVLYSPPSKDPLYNPKNPRSFDDYSKHPNIRIPFTNPKTGRGDYSTAAGAYQIIYGTYLAVSKLAGVTDFSPASQDALAVWLLKGCGALTHIVSGNFDEAVRLASKTWASLPYTDSKQAHVTITAAKTAYTQAGGVFA